MDGYKDDLAYIHDAGFSGYALNLAPGLLSVLKANGVANGLIVDLGCGSGRWARELNLAGYKVLGIDQSAAMIRLARKIAPASKFKVASFLDVDLPRCDAITSIGECLNYCFDAKNSRLELRRLFQRAYDALRPGGIFVFDVAGPTRLPKRTPKEGWAAQGDWAVMWSVTSRGERHVLYRQITSFRKVGKLYRRRDEIHRLQLYRSSDLADDLSQCGFSVRQVAGYGRFRFPQGITGLLARKP